jgi:hypothetical protein
LNHFYPLLFLFIRRRLPVVWRGAIAIFCSHKYPLLLAPIHTKKTNGAMQTSEEH